MRLYHCDIVTVSITKYFSSSFTAPAYENIKIDVVGSKSNVGLIQLNRPKALNALCGPLFKELGQAVRDFDANDKIAAIVITGKCAVSMYTYNII